MGIWDKWAWPVPDFQGRSPVVSSGFNDEMVLKDTGYMRRKHSGVDIMYQRLVPGEQILPWMSKLYEAWPGIPVVAVGPGDVWTVKETAKGAKVIVIDHHNVPGYGPLATAYIHVTDVQVKKGDKVEAGTLLAYMGHTGTKLAHLHFMTSTDKKDMWGVDPETLLAEWGPPTEIERPAEVKPQKTGDMGWLILLLAILLLKD